MERGYKDKRDCPVDEKEIVCIFSTNLQKARLWKRNDWQIYHYMDLLVSACWSYGLYPRLLHDSRVRQTLFELPITFHHVHFPQLLISIDIKYCTHTFLRYSSRRMDSLMLVYHKKRRKYNKTSEVTDTMASNLQPAYWNGDLSWVLKPARNLYRVLETSKTFSFSAR